MKNNWFVNLKHSVVTVAALVACAFTARAALAESSTKWSGATYETFATKPTTVADANTFISGMPAIVKDYITVDAANKTVTLASADAFAFISYLPNYLSALCVLDCAEKSYSDPRLSAYWVGSDPKPSWTVNVTTDIDLQNKDWKPATSGYAYLVDFKNHTVSNLKATGLTTNGGLFGDLYYGQNVTIDGAAVSTTADNAGVFAACLSGYAKNVTIKNASLSGNKYTGAIGGYVYGDVENCKVLGTEQAPVVITSATKEVGSVVGLFAANHVQGCEVAYVAVTGQEEVGGVAGRVVDGDVKAHEITGCSVANVTLKATNNGEKVVDERFVGIADENYVGTICGRDYHETLTVTVGGKQIYPALACVAKIGDTTYPTIAAAYADAKANDTVVLLVDEIASLGAIPAGVTLQGVAEKTKVTASNIESPTFNNVTLKNLKFVADGNAFGYASISGEFKMYNCEFDQVGTYGFHIDGPNGGTVYAEGCVFRSTTAISSGNPAAFKDCEFYSNSHVKDLGLSIYSNTALTNCVFGQEYLPNSDYDSAGGFYVKSNGILVTFDGCSIKNGGNLYDIVKRPNRLTTYEALVAIDGTRASDCKFTDGLFLAKTATVVEAYVADGYDVKAHATVANGWVLEEAPRTVEVTPATVQAALDGAKKGDTIVLTAGDYGELYLRNNGSDANRIMQDVTICVQDGASVTVEQIEYQKVSDKSLDIENLTIDGITFDAPEKTAVLFDCDGAGSIRVNGLAIQNCSKTGNNSQGTTYDNAAFIGGYYDGATALNKTFAGDTSLTCGYHDIRILNNEITNVFQPIKFPNSGPLYGLTVTGNTFTGCTDNHFMLSTKTTGTVLIANNTIVDMTGRFARISGAEAAAAFTITNNTVTTPRMYDTGGDGDIVKITGAAGFTVTQADNQWLDGAYQGDTKWIAMGDAKKLPVCQIGETKYPTMADAYKAAKSGDTVKILVDTIDSIVGIPAGVTVEGVETKTTVTSGMGSPLLNGVTLKNIKFVSPADVFEWPSIQNTFALYNCEFDPKGDYGLKIDGPNGGTIYAEGCIFRSTTAISQGNPATFKNCQFLLNSYSEDFDLSLFTDTTLDGCQFVEDYTASNRGIYVKTDNIVIDLKNCSIISSDKPVTDLFCRKEGYNKGIGVVDGVRNQDGKFIAGTFMTVHCEIPCAEGYVPMLVSGATDVYTLGTLIKKDDETKTVPALEQASDSIVNEQKVEQNVKDETAKEQIKTQTVVEGVKLTTAPEKVGETIVAPAGMQAVVDAAKAKNEQLAEAIEHGSATMVTVKVDVVVSPLAYTNTEAAAEQSVAAFKLEPKATVTVVNTTASGETSKSETVKVTNEMIDKTVDIDVTVYTGFRPEMVVHKDENGKVIETFTGDQIAYDETKKTITVKIHHFSTIEAVKVSYAAQAGDGLYATLAEAFAAVPDATPTTVKLLKDLTLDGAVTFAAGKTATFDFAGRTLTGGSIESAGALTLTGGTTDASLSCTGDGTMAITAGEYKTALPAASDPAETNAGPFLVSGGSFVSAIPWAYCAPGYEPNAATAAPYGVKDANIYIRNIAAAQRYPWNGYVDITLDVSWSTKETARLFVLAYDGDDNRMDMTDAVVIMDGEQTDVDCSKGFSVTAPSKKTLHIMWNSTEAVSEGSVKEGVHFKFIAK